MKKLVGTCIALTCVVSCVSDERRAQIDAEVAKCESNGGTAYVRYGALKLCASATEQARFEKLELACLQGGGEVQRKFGIYKSCKQPKSETNITVNNQVSTGRKCVFTMACKD